MFNLQVNVHSSCLFKTTTVLMLFAAQYSQIVYAMELLEVAPVISAQKAAQAKAHLYLGEMLIKGEGCERDYEKAREYLLLAAQGLDVSVKAWANIRLAMLYHLGWGVEKDQQMVLMYCESASQLAKDCKELDEISELANILKDPLFEVEKKGRGSPLHMAVLKGHKEVVELLIAKGSKIEAKGYRGGETPLHLAAQNGHKGIVELLLLKGADVKAVTKNGSTALHKAAKNGIKDSAELLLSEGADIKAMDKNGYTPLHWAALGGHREVVELLLAKGADIKAVSENGDTSLHWAARRGYREVVELLLAKGADIKAVDHDGLTSLHYAAWNGHREVVALLLAKGADLKAVTKDGRTPLHFAAQEWS